ncbi:hypothetical protein [Natronorubrum aibiense]|nr:hypothetical protein [Natronorubrum aibiense]
MLADHTGLEALLPVAQGTLETIVVAAGLVVRFEEVVDSVFEGAFSGRSR